jgi:hypothetical protein
MSKDPAGRPLRGVPAKLVSLTKRRVTKVSGGARRDRTDDLMLAKHALSQLSYGPEGSKLVGPGRLELPTSRLSGVRSNHLSYGPPVAREPAAGRLVPNGISRRADAHYVACEERETKAAKFRMFGQL